VLPLGMNVQKDNREETIIDQDATVFIEAIRGGLSSPYGTDLTNYVYLITNTVTQYNPSGAAMGTKYYGYTFTTPYEITNNARIIGLLSTPEYVDNFGAPIPNLINGGYSNHVVAYVRSISGPAVEKPPQDNPILQQDSFSYKIFCDNVPVAIYTPPFWQQASYNTNAYVSYTNANGQTTYWQATAKTAVNDFPNNSFSVWARILYPQELTANLHELRLTFLWPLLPSGNTGAGRQAFRTLVGGQIIFTNDTSVTPNQWMYFLQSQSFTNTP